MLILERQLNERIFIGDSIIVTVTQIGHNKVRLGIEAPKSVTIYREEARDKHGN